MSKETSPILKGVNWPIRFGLALLTIGLISKSLGSAQDILGNPARFRALLAQDFFSTINYSFLAPALMALSIFLYIVRRINLGFIVVVAWLALSFDRLIQAVGFFLGYLGGQYVSAPPSLVIYFFVLLAVPVLLILGRPEVRRIVNRKA